MIPKESDNKKEGQKEILDLQVKRSASATNIVSKELFSMSKLNSLINKETPSFRHRSISEDRIKHDMIEVKAACYDTPDRYLYEFYNHKGYHKFRRQYLKALKRKNNKYFKFENYDILGDPNK
jgi:hypothetical protein